METMSAAGIARYVNELQSRRYATGVLTIAPPAWMEDLAWCLRAIAYLLAELEKERNRAL